MIAVGQFIGGMDAGLLKEMVDNTEKPCTRQIEKDRFYIKL